MSRSLGSGVSDEKTLVHPAFPGSSWKTGCFHGRFSPERPAVRSPGFKAIRPTETTGNSLQEPGKRAREHRVRRLTELRNACIHMGLQRSEFIPEIPDEPKLFRFPARGTHGDRMQFFTCLTVWTKGPSRDNSQNLWKVPNKHLTRPPPARVHTGRFGESGRLAAIAIGSQGPCGLDGARTRRRRP